MRGGIESISRRTWDRLKQCLQGRVAQEPHIGGVITSERAPVRREILSAHGRKWLAPRTQNRTGNRGPAENQERKPKEERPKQAGKEARKAARQAGAQRGEREREGSKPHPKATTAH